MYKYAFPGVTKLRCYTLLRKGEGWASYPCKTPIHWNLDNPEKGKCPNCHTTYIRCLK